MFITCQRPDVTGLMPITSSQTIKQYITKAISLRRQCAAACQVPFSETTPEEVIQWFLLQEGRWTTSTLRAYRRAIELWLLHCGAAKKMEESAMHRLLKIVAAKPTPRSS
jgi:hypothetical protein